MQERGASCLLCNPRGVRLFIASDSPAKKGEADLFLAVPRETVPSGRHWYPALYIYLGPKKTFQQYAQSPSTTDRVAVGMVSLGQSITRL